jgi:hypothetical protein
VLASVTTAIKMSKESDARKKRSAGSAEMLPVVSVAAMVDF